MAFLPVSASAEIKPKLRRRKIGQQVIFNAAAETALEFIPERSIDILIFDLPAVDIDWSIDKYVDWFSQQIYPMIDHCAKDDAVVIYIPRDRKGGKFSKGIVGAAIMQMKGWEHFRQLIWERQEADFSRNKYAFGNIFFLRRGNRPSKRDSPIAFKDIIRVKDNPEGFVGEVPFEIYEMCLSRWYQSGDVMMDPFAGTGSLASACQKLGYASISIELDPDEFDNIVERIKREQI